MSLQDDAFDVNTALLQRAELLHTKPSLKEEDPIYKAFGNIVARLWQFETELEDSEKVIAAQNLLLTKHLAPSEVLDIGDACPECGQEWTGTL